MSKAGGRWVKPVGFVERLWLPDGCDYDPVTPDRFEDFSRSYLSFPDGFRAGAPIEWASWQLDRLIRPMLGVRWKASGLRATRTAFFLAGRGNAKTTLAAAVALWGLLDPEETNPEIDLFSLSRETAHRAFRVIANLVRANPVLDGGLNVSAHIRKITAPAVGGELVVRSGDADAEMGLNPSIALVDELASLRTRELWDAVKSAFGKRPEGLLITMTTPSLDVGKFARLEYDNAKQIAADRSLDPTYLPVLYETSERDDPWSEKTWHKANPGLKSGFLDIGIIRQEAADAQRDKTREHAFRVLRLAQWAQAGGGFLDMTAWNDCATDFDGLAELAELPCWMGLDMASASDLASLAVLWWDNEQDIAYVLWKHWSTTAMMERLNQHTGGQWRVWCDSDAVSLRLFRSDWIDDYGVAEDVMEMAGRYHPVSVGIDSYRGKKMYQLLGEQGGLTVDHLSQTGRAMQAATERTQAMVGKRRLYHNGDPVARWCAVNTEVTYDGYGFPKIVKRDLDPNVRIDAMAALTMAVDRRLAWERDGGVFEPQAFVYTPTEPAAEPKERELVRVGDRQ